MNMTVSTGRRPGIMSVIVCPCGLRRQSCVPRRGRCRGHPCPASFPLAQAAGYLARVSLDRRAPAHQDRSVDSFRGPDLVAPRYSMRSRRAFGALAVCGRRLRAVLAHLKQGEHRLEDSPGTVELSRCWAAAAALSAPADGGGPATTE